MSQLAKIRVIASRAAISTALVLATAGAVFAPAAAAAPVENPKADPPNHGVDSGPQATMQMQPGKAAAYAEVKGESKLTQTEMSGKLSARIVTPLRGFVSGADLTQTYNYCWHNFVYTPVKNNTGSTQYVHVVLYNQGVSRDYYTSIAAHGTAYPGFYGVEGTYYVYLYVWNGSSYMFDEYKTSNNTCNVQVSRIFNTSGWVLLKIQNKGTAYASQQSTELAPYPANGTYTGTHYDYPVAGGAPIYRWFYVGYRPYGIVSHTLNSTNNPMFFTGDL